MLKLNGYGVSSGIAMGQVLKIDRGMPPVYKFRFQDDNVLQLELERFDEAIRSTIHQLNDFQNKLERELGRDHSLMIQAHIMILQDRHFSGAIRELILEERVNADWAVTVIAERIQEVYKNLKDPYLQDKIHDIRDITSRLLNNIVGRNHTDTRNGYENIILVSSEINLSLLSVMDFSHLKGFAVDFGGWTSHTSIIARSLEIPSVIHLKEITRKVHTGDFILLDGSSGTVFIAPDNETIQHYQELQQQRRRSSLEVEGPYCLVTKTEKSSRKKTGLQDLKIYLNAEMPLELKDYSKYNVDGIGLFRSEFILLRKQMDDVTLEDHVSVYRQLSEAVYPCPANIRTFDMVADKMPDAIGKIQETNPALGLRGIRLSIYFQEIFRQQLKGILTANEKGNLRITFPFISSLDEVITSKKILEQVNDELTGEKRIPIPIGAMLEIPSTLFIADALCDEIDFFTLGTNDLVQFTLARDRSGTPYSSPFDSAHPAVRRGLEMIYDVTSKRKKEIVCCGEMASHPFFVLILLAIGFRNLSVNPPVLPLIRHLAEYVDSKSLRKFYTSYCKLDTLQKIESFFMEELENFFPDHLVQTLLLAYQIHMK